MSTNPMGFSCARILVADDHPLVRRHVGAVLGEEGYQICGEAADGREAVEMAAILKPDLVVLDLTMPELNGLEAARLILGKTPEIQIVIFTMHSDEELTRVAADAGVAACIGKSDIEHLIAEVHGLLRPPGSGESSFRSPATPLRGRWWYPGPKAIKKRKWLTSNRGFPSECFEMHRRLIAN